MAAIVQRPERNESVYPELPHSLFKTRTTRHEQNKIQSTKAPTHLGTQRTTTAKVRVIG